jgi:hypothetical protein
MAKDELENVQETAEPSTGLDRLFAEALAVLSDPDRLADS